MASSGVHANSSINSTSSSPVDLGNPNIAITSFAYQDLIDQSEIYSTQQGKPNTIIIQDQTMIKCTIVFRSASGKPIQYLNCFFFSCIFRSIAKTTLNTPSLDGCVLNQCTIPSVIYDQVVNTRTEIQALTQELNCVMNGCIFGHVQADPSVSNQTILNPFVDFQNLDVSDANRLTPGYAQIMSNVQLQLNNGLTNVKDDNQIKIKKMNYTSTHMTNIECYDVQQPVQSIGSIMQGSVSIQSDCEAKDVSGSLIYEAYSDYEQTFVNFERMRQIATETSIIEFPIDQAYYMQFCWADTGTPERSQKDFCFLIKALNEVNDEIGLTLLHNANIDPTLLANIISFYNISSVQVITVDADKEVLIHDVATEVPTGDTTTQGIFVMNQDALTTSMLGNVCMDVDGIRQGQTLLYQWTDSTKLQVIKLDALATLGYTKGLDFVPYRNVKLTMTNLIKNMQGVSYNLDYDKFASHSLVQTAHLKGSYGTSFIRDSKMYGPSNTWETSPYENLKFKFWFAQANGGTAMYNFRCVNYATHVSLTTPIPQYQIPSAPGQYYVISINGTDTNSYTNIYALCSSSVSAINYTNPVEWYSQEKTTPYDHQMFQYMTPKQGAFYVNVGTGLDQLNSMLAPGQNKMFAIKGEIQFNRFFQYQYNAALVNGFQCVASFCVQNPYSQIYVKSLLPQQQQTLHVEFQTDDRDQFPLNDPPIVQNPTDYFVCDRFSIFCDNVPMMVFATKDQRTTGSLGDQNGADKGISRYITTETLDKWIYLQVGQEINGNLNLSYTLQVCNPLATLDVNSSGAIQAQTTATGNERLNLNMVANGALYFDVGEDFRTCVFLFALQLLIMENVQPALLTSLISQKVAYDAQASTVTRIAVSLQWYNLVYGQKLPAPSAIDTIPATEYVSDIALLLYSKGALTIQPQLQYSQQQVRTNFTSLNGTALYQAINIFNAVYQLIGCRRQCLHTLWIEPLYDGTYANGTPEKAIQTRQNINSAFYKTYHYYSNEFFMALRQQAATLNVGTQIITQANSNLSLDDWKRYDTGMQRIVYTIAPIQASASSWSNLSSQYVVDWSLQPNLSHTLYIVLRDVYFDDITFYTLYETIISQLNLFGQNTPLGSGTLGLVNLIFEVSKNTAFWFDYAYSLVPPEQLSRGQEGEFQQGNYRHPVSATFTGSSLVKRQRFGTAFDKLIDPYQRTININKIPCSFKRSYHAETNTFFQAHKVANITDATVTPKPLKIYDAISSCFYEMASADVDFDTQYSAIVFQYRPMIDTLFTDPLTGATTTNTGVYINISDLDSNGVCINIQNPYYNIAQMRMKMIALQEDKYTPQQPYRPYSSQTELNPTRKIPYFLLYRNNLTPRASLSNQNVYAKGEVLPSIQSISQWRADTATNTTTSSQMLSTTMLNFTSNHDGFRLFTQCNGLLKAHNDNVYVAAEDGGYVNQGNTHMHDYLSSYFIDARDYSYWQDPHLIADFSSVRDMSISRITTLMTNYYDAVLVENSVTSTYARGIRQGTAASLAQALVADYLSQMTNQAGIVRVGDIHDEMIVYRAAAAHGAQSLFYDLLDEETKSEMLVSLVTRQEIFIGFLVYLYDVYGEIVEFYTDDITKPQFLPNVSFFSSFPQQGRMAFEPYLFHEKHNGILMNNIADISQVYISPDYDGPQTLNQVFENVGTFNKCRPITDLTAFRANLDTAQPGTSGSKAIIGLDMGLGVVIGASMSYSYNQKPRFSQNKIISDGTLIGIDKALHSIAFGSSHYVIGNDQFLSRGKFKGPDYYSANYGDVLLSISFVGARIPTLDIPFVQANVNFADIIFAGTIKDSNNVDFQPNYKLFVYTDTPNDLIIDMSKVVLHCFIEIIFMGPITHLFIKGNTSVNMYSTTLTFMAGVGPNIITQDSAYPPRVCMFNCNNVNRQRLGMNKQMRFIYNPFKALTASSSADVRDILNYRGEPGQNGQVATKINAIKGHNSFPGDLPFIPTFANNAQTPIDQTSAFKSQLTAMMPQISFSGTKFLYSREDLTCPQEHQALMQYNPYWTSTATLINEDTQTPLAFTYTNTILETLSSSQPVQALVVGKYNFSLTSSAILDNLASSNQYFVTKKQHYSPIPVFNWNVDPAYLSYYFQRNSSVAFPATIDTQRINLNIDTRSYGFNQVCGRTSTNARRSQSYDNTNLILTSAVTCMTPRYTLQGLQLCDNNIVTPLCIDPTAPMFDVNNAPTPAFIPNVVLSNNKGFFICVPSAISPNISLGGLTVAAQTMHNTFNLRGNVYIAPVSVTPYQNDPYRNFKYKFFGSRALVNTLPYNVDTGIIGNVPGVDMTLAASFSGQFCQYVDYNGTYEVMPNKKGFLVQSLIDYTYTDPSYGKTKDQTYLTPSFYKYQQQQYPINQMGSQMNDVDDITMAQKYIVQVNYDSTVQRTRFNINGTDALQTAIGSEIIPGVTTNQPMTSTLYGIEYNLCDYLMENSDQVMPSVHDAGTMKLNAGGYQQAGAYDEDLMRYMFSSFYVPWSFVAICSHDSTTQVDLQAIDGYGLCLLLAQELVANKPGINTLAAALSLSDPNPLILIKKMLIALRGGYQTTMNTALKATLDQMTALTTPFTYQIQNEPQINPNTPEIVSTDISDYVTLAQFILANTDKRSNIQLSVQSMSNDSKTLLLESNVLMELNYTIKGMLSSPTTIINPLYSASFIILTNVENVLDGATIPMLDVIKIEANNSTFIIKKQPVTDTSVGNTLREKEQAGQIFSSDKLVYSYFDKCTFKSDGTPSEDEQGLIFDVHSKKSLFSDCVFINCQINQIQDSDGQNISFIGCTFIDSSLTINNSTPITSSSRDGGVVVQGCAFVSSATSEIWREYENTLSTYVTRNSINLDNNTLQPKNYEIVINSGAQNARQKSITQTNIFNKKFTLAIIFDQAPPVDPQYDEFYIVTSKNSSTQTSFDDFVRITKNCALINFNQGSRDSVDHQLLYWLNMIQSSPIDISNSQVNYIKENNVSAVNSGSLSVNIITHYAGDPTQKRPFTLKINNMYIVLDNNIQQVIPTVTQKQMNALPQRDKKAYGALSLGLTPPQSSNIPVDQGSGQLIIDGEAKSKVKIVSFTQQLKRAQDLVATSFTAAQIIQQGYGITICVTAVNPDTGVTQQLSFIIDQRRGVNDSAPSAFTKASFVLIMDNGLQPSALNQIVAGIDSTIYDIVYLGPNNFTVGGGSSSMLKFGAMTMSCSSILITKYSAAFNVVITKMEAYNAETSGKNTYQDIYDAITYKGYALTLENQKGQIQVSGNTFLGYLNSSLFKNSSPSTASTTEYLDNNTNYLKIPALLLGNANGTNSSNTSTSAATFFTYFSRGSLSQYFKATINMDYVNGKTLTLPLSNQINKYIGQFQKLVTPSLEYAASTRIEDSLTIYQKGRFLCYPQFVSQDGADLIALLQTALQTLPSLDFTQNIDMYNIPQSLKLALDRFAITISLNARTLSLLDSQDSYYLIVQHDTKEYDTILTEDLNNPGVSDNLKGPNAYSSYFEIRIRTNLPSYTLTITQTQFATPGVITNASIKVLAQDVAKAQAPVIQKVGNKAVLAPLVDDAAVFLFF